ncbi:serine hydrolase [Paraburkholderia sp. GAS334]|uniref:serine hydrolase n=1 Tax=Paraburkholderia sp. GAS334 TaxID=3035131 RepID=UPI003D1A2D18
MKNDPFSPPEAMRAIALCVTPCVLLSMVIAVALATVPLDSTAEPVADRNPDVAAMHARLAEAQKVSGTANTVKDTIAIRTYGAGTSVVTASEPGGRLGYVRASKNGRRAHSESIDDVAFEPRTSLSSRPFTVREGQQAPALRSTIAYVVDQTTGEPLVDKNSQAVVPIASITKLMTAMVVLDSKAPLSEPLEVSDEDRDFEKHSGSRLSIGSMQSREDMLHIALMASENRAAAALSRYYPGGRPAFIAAMNQKARSLGMMDTHFENPAGLSKLNVSSARDLVKMVEAAYQYRLIREFSTDPGYQVNTGKGVLSYHNTNMLIHDRGWDIGLQKTGFINESGICLVMQTTIRGRPVVMVLLDSVGRHSDFADAGRLRAMLTDGESHLSEAGTARSRS